jgi:peptidylprolyl isomerase
MRDLHTTLTSMGVALALATGALAQPPAAKPKAPTTADVLAAAPKSDWRRLDPDRTLYMDLPAGRVIIELAPAFAPNHVANLRVFTRERYFDGLAVIRVQDNFVAQWGDPEEGEKAKSLGSAKAKLAPEFVRADLKGVTWTKLPDRDVYADEVGFADGFPVARDPRTGKAWLAHCYGSVAVARDNGEDTGNASQLYMAIGPARQLDRNLTVVGRVVQGMDLLSSLPRGKGNLGFYKEAKERTPIVKLRFASELPPAERVALEALRTDTKTFATVTDLKRNRKDAFYNTPTGHIDLCAVSLPVRAAKP